MEIYGPEDFDDQDDFDDFLRRFIDQWYSGLPDGTLPNAMPPLEYLKSILGPLPEGAVNYAYSDLDGDGKNELYAVDADGNPHTVYGSDDDRNVTTTPYADWSAPDLSELIEKYGEDAVNDLKGKYDELVDFIGNIPEDPLGSIKKMAEVFIEGATGISPDCQKQTTGTETELETWILDCVNVGILVDIGIPSLPGLGGIFKSTTLRDIKEAAEKVGSTLEDFINGNPTCGEKNDQECTPEQILEDLGNWVVRGVEDIFGGVDDIDSIDIETILGKLGGIFGPVLSGIIYDQFKDLINKEIENTIGIPVIPISQGCTGTQEGLVDYNDGKGCVEPCPADPRFSKDSPYCVEDYDCSQAGREQVEGATTANDCGACTEVAEDNTPFEVNPTTGFCEDPTIDDPSLTEQEQLCKDTGRKYDDLNDICLKECDNPQYKIDADGDCGPPDSVEQCTDPHREKDEDGSCGVKCTDGSDAVDGTPCPDPNATPTGPDGITCEDGMPGDAGDFNLVEKQNWWAANCKDTHCTDGTKIPENGVCGGNGPDDLCDDGSEPFYRVFDEDKDGTFTDPRNGKNYTYDPCDQTQPPVEVDPEGNDPDGSNGFVVNCKEPKLGFTPSFDLELNAAYAEYSAKYDDECGTGGPPDPTEPCPDFNGVEGPRDAEGNCYDCTDPANSLACGWIECDDGTMAPTLEDCGTGTTPCDQQDRVTNGDGSCGECKPGFIEDPEGFDQCITAPPGCNDCTCAEYAANNPKECTTCPEGQSYCDSTGQCETAENCDDGDDGGDGGSGGGGGGGMFQPYTFAIAADPQLQTRQEFPITDFLAGIFTGTGGGKA